jgi:bifunctional DNA-binding transcriptional regulator/antitoxin component of YhaV-PrlF toxin-antitoxin module
MRANELKVSNGTLALPQEILSYLNLKDGESVILQTKEDGSVSIRRKETIANLKGIIKKGETPDLHADQHYEFNANSNLREES